LQKKVKHNEKNGKTPQKMGKMGAIFGVKWRSVCDSHLPVSSAKWETFSSSFWAAKRRKKVEKKVERDEPKW